MSRERSTAAKLVLVATVAAACGDPVDDGKTWTKTAGSPWLAASTSGPPSRRNAALAYDPIRGRTVLFGGQTEITARADTWEWDGSAKLWTALGDPTSPGPIARSGFGMVFNPDRGRVVLFGNAKLLPSEDLWEWSGTEWTERVLATPLSPRYRSTFAYDAAHQAFLVYGGRFALTAGNLTKLLQYRSNVTVEACTSATLDYDGDGKAGCADEDCWASCTPLCPPGVACPATAPRCGDGVRSPFEDCAMCPSDFGGPCPGGRCGDYACDPGETQAGCPLDCP